MNTALKLAILFRKEYIKYDYKIYSLSTVKNSRWWNIFEKINDKYPDINQDIFIKCNFEKNGKILPPYLLSKEAYNTYNDYKSSYEEKKDFTVDTLKSILFTLRQINNQNIKTFLIDNKDKIIKGYYNIYLFLFCKSFYKIFSKEEINTILTYDQIKIRKNILIKNVKIEKFLKQYLKEEFI